MTSGQLEVKVKAVEIRAELRQIKTMADGSVTITLNLGERYREQAKVMLDWHHLIVRGVLVLEDEESEEYTVDPDGPGPAAAFSFYNPDFNYKSLRGTIVLRWEYLPGSTLYFVWTQNRADYSHPGDLQLRRDLGDLLTAPGDNIFVLKITYRWHI